MYNVFAGSPRFGVLVPFGRPLGAVGEGRRGGRADCRLALLVHGRQRGGGGGRGGSGGGHGGGGVVVVAGKTVEEGTGAAGGATLKRNDCSEHPRENVDTKSNNNQHTKIYFAHVSFGRLAELLHAIIGNSEAGHAHENGRRKVLI